MHTIKQSALLLILLLFISCSVSSDYLPDKFFGLRLVKKFTGSEAKEYVNRLHFQNVTDTENEIGFYEEKAGSAIIYITHYNTSETAKKDYEKMVNKISPENSVFINSEYIKINGLEVYRCFGMGQSHYVFPYNKALFWISVDSHFGRKFVEEYLIHLSNM